MRLATLSQTLKNYKKGTYVRVGYITDLSASTKASEKKSGIKVEKKVEKTARLGCDYHNMKKTIEAKENGRGTRDMYEVAIIDNVLYANKKNDTLYLRVGNVENNNQNTVWLVNGKEVSKEEASKYLVPSYFNKKGSVPEVQNIKLDNITFLGN